MKESKEKLISREKRGVRTAIVGLALNLLLGVSKLVAGIFTGSMAVTADGINNLSDVGTSAVTVSSFALSSKKADKEHPFGHGRFEYIAGFVISAIILLVGAELIISSVNRLIEKDVTMTFSTLAFALLCVSVAVKAFMAVFYYVRNRKIGSDTLKAACFDSTADAVSTFLVGTAFLLDGIVAFPFDAVGGILTALFIVFGGFKLVLSTINKLMGGGHDEEVENAVTELVREYDEVLGIHDLMVHDYGAGRKVASVDAEFDMNMPFVAVHSVVDAIEREAEKRLGVSLVVHPDPVNVTDESYLQLCHAVRKVTDKYGKNATFHELTVDNDQISLHLRLGDKLMKVKETVTAEIVGAISEQKPDAKVTVICEF